jgi:hypothetical protein
MNGSNLLIAVFCATVAFFLGLLTATLLQGGDHKMLFDLTVAGIGSFGGAVAGGYSAFALEERRRQREQHDRQIAAANVALVTLSSMWSVLYNYEKKIIRKAIADDQSPDPLWLRIRPGVSRREALTFNIENLVFLLKTSDPMALHELILQGQRYFDLNEAIDMLAQTRGPVLERMEAAGVGLTGDPTRDELIAVIGPLGVTQLSTLTKGLIEYLYRCMADMTAFHRRLQSLLRAEFGEDEVKAIALEDFAAELPMPVPAWIERAVKKCDWRIS